VTTRQPVSLDSLSEKLLQAARGSSNGTAAVTVYHGKLARQVLIALAEEHGLKDHDNPGEAMLQVLRGRVRLSAASGEWVGVAGEHLPVPPERHALTALQDAAVLLTVVPDTGGRP
jgi:quercetin dioxygenase-like cupin family protein